VGRVGRKFLRGGPAGGKNGHVHAVKDVFFQFVHGEFTLAVGHFDALGTGGSEGPHFRGGKVPVVQGLEHFSAHGARGAHNGNGQLFAHLVGSPWVVASAPGGGTASIDVSDAKGKALRQGVAAA